MKLDEKQMDAAFDAITAEARAKHERANLIQKKKELANPLFSWRIAFVLIATAFFTATWLVMSEMKLLGATAAIITIVSGRWLWRQKISSQIKDIEKQINAIRY